MIQYSKHRRAFQVSAAASGVLIAYGWTQRKGPPIALGALVLLGSAAGIALANEEDRNLVRNPEVMNGHFLTGGTASALASADDVPYLRSLMGVPQHQPPRRRHGGGPHGHRLR